MIWVASRSGVLGKRHVVAPNHTRAAVWELMASAVCAHAHFAFQSIERFGHYTALIKICCGQVSAVPTVRNMTDQGGPGGLHSFPKAPAWRTIRKDSRADRPNGPVRSVLTARRTANPLRSKKDAAIAASLTAAGSAITRGYKQSPLHLRRCSADGHGHAGRLPSVR
jgi:hypothetical protein